MINKKQKIIVIVGTTASGKTSLAVDLAWKFNGEVVSADSRQVYKYMDVGTGKDLEEYIVRKQKTENRKQIFRWLSGRKKRKRRFMRLKSRGECRLWLVGLGYIRRPWLIIMT